MNIPNFQNVPMIASGGYFSDTWTLIFQQLFSELQSDVGNEGFVISSISSDPDSVAPPTTGGQVARIESSFGLQNGVQAGTVIFDPYEVNGATLPVRNGQLKVLLNDGTFHAITNT